MYVPVDEWVSDSYHAAVAPTNCRRAELARVPMLQLLHNHRSTFIILNMISYYTVLYDRRSRPSSSIEPYAGLSPRSGSHTLSAANVVRRVGRRPHRQDTGATASPGFATAPHRSLLGPQHSPPATAALTVADTVRLCLLRLASHRAAVRRWSSSTAWRRGSRRTRSW